MWVRCRGVGGGPGAGKGWQQGRQEQEPPPAGPEAFTEEDTGGHAQGQV